MCRLIALTLIQWAWKTVWEMYINPIVYLRFLNYRAGCRVLIKSESTGELHFKSMIFTLFKMFSMFSFSTTFQMRNLHLKQCLIVNLKRNTVNTQFCLCFQTFGYFCSVFIILFRWTIGPTILHLEMLHLKRGLEVKERGSAYFLEM